MFSQTSRRLVVVLNVPLTKSASASSRRTLFNQASSKSRFSRKNTRVRPMEIPKTIYSPTQIRTAVFVQRVRRTFRSAARDIWRKNPVLFPFTIVSLIVASAFCTYIIRTIYVQMTELNAKTSRFPDPVAKELRKALYATKINLEPQKALDHYKAALAIADEIGMHPYSDEVIGIKLQLADMLVEAGYHQKAVQLLARISSEAVAWVNKTRARLSVTIEKKKQFLDPNLQEILAPNQEDYDYELRQTTRTLKKVIGIQLLLGELYENEHLKQPREAFVARRNALDLMRQEIGNRQSRGLPPVVNPEEEDDWLNAEEAGHTMSDLGETWLRAGRPDKALELLMPALAILRDVEGKEISCRQVVLLSNIAASMFDHKQDEQNKSDKKGPIVTVEKQMEASREWALNAIEVSKTVPEDLHDDDCDIGCAAAADVLSAIADWQGADEEARKWLREEKRYCESANYAEGVEKAVKLLAEKDQNRRKKRPT